MAVVEIVSATRVTEAEFWSSTALGISLQRILSVDQRAAPMICVSNSRGLPGVFNDRLAATSSQAIVFVHDDIWIEDYYFVDRVIDGLKSFDAIGVVGNRRRLDGMGSWVFKPGVAEWDTGFLSGRVAHGDKPFGPITIYGPTPAACELLDGIMLAVSVERAKAQRVQFDSRFAFHFYDLDFCRTARAHGLSLGTWPISLCHQGRAALGSAEWERCRELYFEKWGS